MMETINEGIFRKSISFWIQHIFVWVLSIKRMDGNWYKTGRGTIQRCYSWTCSHWFFWGIWGQYNNVQQLWHFDFQTVASCRHWAVLSLSRHVLVSVFGHVMSLNQKFTVYFSPTDFGRPSDGVRQSYIERRRSRDPVVHVMLHKTLN